MFLVATIIQRSASSMEMFFSQDIRSNRAEIFECSRKSGSEGTKSPRQDATCFE